MYTNKTFSTYIFLIISITLLGTFISEQSGDAREAEHDNNSLVVFSEDNLKVIRQKIAANHGLQLWDRELGDYKQHKSRKVVATTRPASYKKPISVYSLEQLQSYMGDPLHNIDILSPDISTLLLLDADDNVLIRDMTSDMERVIQKEEGGSWGSAGSQWSTCDRGVLDANNSEFAISVTTNRASGKTTFWDTRTWEDVTKYLWPRNTCYDGHIKVSPDGRYAAIAGDGPKFGDCLSLIDFDKREYRLLSGMKYLNASGSYHPIDGISNLLYRGGNFRFGFTPDSQQLVVENSATEFQLYTMSSQTTTDLSFPEKTITDIRYLDGDPNDPSYDFNNSEFGEDPYVADIKVFQKAMREERLDIITKYFDFPITRGERRIHSVAEFVEHFDEIFPEDYRKMISEEEISKVGLRGYMLGNGTEWFSLDGATVISNY